MQILPISSWNLPISISRPLLIAGPCSAETRAQVLASCDSLATRGAQLLRAGIWKPRTRPNSFEGMGIKALPWLKEAGQKTGLPVCTEVAKATHVEQALAHDIDVLWIGARTTVNPFAVQEIADALKGVDVPVLVKNPINPDIGLWLGAFERLHQAGIQKMAAIHRGFSFYGASRYRNEPLWELPIELRRQMPALEIICDPSHIAGQRDLLLEIAQKALDLNFDGLMIETHHMPEQAWSDAAQQVTPEGLSSLLEQLIHRRTSSDNPVFTTRLEKLRGLIDDTDYALLDILARRMDIVREIGEYKKQNDITILQLERWLEIFKTRSAKASSLQLAPEFIQALFNSIHQESIRQQTTIMNTASAASNAALDS